MQQTIKKRKVIVLEEKAEVVQINIFENIYFTPGSSSLPHNVDITLASIVIAMSNDKQTKVSITSFYDNTGSPTSNKTLAMQRAKKLRNTLVTLGIPIERTQIKQPLKMADSDKFKNVNSVEVRVTK